MPLEDLRSADDPRVNDYRAIGDRELVRRRGLFVAEGRMILRRIVDDGRYRLRSVLVSPQASRELEGTFARLDPQVPIYVCPASEFLKITGFNIHRGCLALVERLPDLPLEAIVPACNALVVLEDVANADNVGGVFRNAAAFGVGAVVLSPACCDPLYRKAIRTSMGAALSVPFARLDQWPAPIEQVRAAGFHLVALTPHGDAQTLDEFADSTHARKLALMIGNEGSGLTAAAEAMADVRVRIPMRGDVDSLNLAVAAGIALYRLGISAGSARTTGIRRIE